MKIVRGVVLAWLAIAFLVGRAWADPITTGCISVTTIRSAQPEFGLPSFWDVHANFDPGPVPSGSYDAYCANRHRAIFPFANYATTVFELTDGAAIAALNLISLPQNLDLVEWVLNQGFVGMPSSGNGAFTSDDVQGAIWGLLDGPNANLGTASSLKDWEQVRVDEIVAAAEANGEGYVAQCGELKGLLLNPVNGVAQSQNSGCLPIADPLTAPPAFQVLIIGVPADCDPGPLPVILACVSEAQGQVGAPYSSSLVASGGTPPYVFSITQGTLPPGLMLDANTGVISGIPTVAGTFPFTATVVDSEATGGQQIVNQECNIVVQPEDPETYCVQEAPLLNGNLSHALWLPGIGTDYIFGNSPGQFVDNGDGTATLTGTVYSRSSPNEGWEINVTLSGLVLPPGPAPAGSPKLELPDSSYAPDGPVDPETWAYQTELTGTLVGVGGLEGAVINLTRFGPAWQEGVGANGKNHAYGASVWLSLEVASNPPGKVLVPSGHGDFNLNISTDCPPPPPAPCSECDGKVTQLTLQYGGPAATVKVVAKSGSSLTTVFDGPVGQDGQFTVVGTDAQGTLGTEIKLYVNGVFQTAIHTSCSQPIGPGLVAGQFTVVSGYSRNGGLLCPISTPPPPPPSDCGPCDGKITRLTLQYDGPSATIKVKSKSGKTTTTIFEETVAAGGQFTVIGQDKNGTLGTEIKIYINGSYATAIHTSCSQPVGPGMVFGKFTIVEGYSRNGGRLCAAPPPAPKPVCLNCVSSTSGTVGTAYSSSLRASGGVPPYQFSIISGSLPPGLTLDAGTGVISGNPTQSGTFAFTAKVTDTLGTSGSSAAGVNCSIQIRQPACPPVNLGCLAAGTGKVGVTYSSSFAVSGGAAPYQFAIISGSLPPGLSLNTVTGEVSGKPTHSGTYSFTAKVIAKGCSSHAYDTVACKVVINPAISNCELVTGDTATIGYWNGPNGQALIKSLNGGSSSKQLGNWLASNFPNLFGGYAGSDNLSNKSNYDVAAKFKQFFSVSGRKTKAQILAAALAVYVTDSDLAGNTAAGSGFNVSGTGTGAKCYKIGSYGDDIGLNNYQSYSIMDLLKQANLNKKHGCFNDWAFNAIFDGVNQKGDRL